MRSRSAGGRGQQVLVQGEELGAVDRELVQRGRRVLDPPGRHHLGQRLERAAAAHRELGLERRDLGDDRREHLARCGRAIARRSRLRDRVGADELVAEARHAERARSWPRSGCWRRRPSPRGCRRRGRSTARGTGSSTTDARTAPKISRASSSPPITSTCTPVSARMRSTTSPPFSARRIAAVALARISVAPAASARRRKRRTVATAWSAAVTGIAPWRLTTSPRRSISFSCTSGSMWPSGWTSATSMWNEFDPRSIAATRIAVHATAPTAGSLARRYGGAVTGSELAPPARFRAMGTDVEVLAVGADANAMATLGAVAADALEVREARWSRFRPTSELCRLNDAAGAPVVVSASTFSLLARAVDAWRDTGGRYDPTVLTALEAAGYDRDFDSITRTGADARSPLSPPRTPGCGDVELDDRGELGASPARRRTRPRWHRQGRRGRRGVRRAPRGRRGGRHRSVGEPRRRSPGAR